jgi:NADH-quinone oxidoreductase subunit C
MQDEDIKIESDEFRDLLKHLIGPDLISADMSLGELVLKIYPASVLRVLTILSHHHVFDFKQLVDLTVVDYPSRSQRFDVVYHLLSLSNNQRVRVKMEIANGDAVQSITPLFANANWYEREVWDLFGIAFADHPDLRRILTDYSFSGHPLRKDFPLSGYTQVRYCDVEKKVIYEPLSLAQEYREFDFISPFEK